MILSLICHLHISKNIWYVDFNARTYTNADIEHTYFEPIR